MKQKTNENVMESVENDKSGETIARLLVEIEGLKRELKPFKDKEEVQKQNDILVNKKRDEDIVKVLKLVKMSIPKFELRVPVPAGAVRNTVENLFESSEISLETYKYLIGQK